MSLTSVELCLTVSLRVMSVCCVGVCMFSFFPVSLPLPAQHRLLPLSSLSDWLTVVLFIVSLDVVTVLGSCRIVFLPRLVHRPTVTSCLDFSSLCVSVSMDVFGYDNIFSCFLFSPPRFYFFWWIHLTLLVSMEEDEIKEHFLLAPSPSSLVCKRVNIIWKRPSLLPGYQSMRVSCLCVVSFSMSGSSLFSWCASCQSLLQWYPLFSVLFLVTVEIRHLHPFPRSHR